MAAAGRLPLVVRRHVVDHLQQRQRLGRALGRPARSEGPRRRRADTLLPLLVVAGDIELEPVRRLFGDTSRPPTRPAALPPTRRHDRAVRSRRHCPLASDRRRRRRSGSAATTGHRCGSTATRGRSRAHDRTEPALLRTPSLVAARRSGHPAHDRAHPVVPGVQHPVLPERVTCRDPLLALLRCLHEPLRVVPRVVLPRPPPEPLLLGPVEAAVVGVPGGDARTVRRGHLVVDLARDRPGRDLLTSYRYGLDVVSVRSMVARPCAARSISC